MEQTGIVASTALILGSVALGLSIDAQVKLNNGSGATGTSGQSIVGPTGASGQSVVGPTGASGIVGATGAMAASSKGVFITASGVSVAFVQNVEQVISIPGWSTVTNTGEFSFDTTTGEATYTGSTTRYYDITIGYCLTKAIVSSLNTFLAFIAINGVFVNPSPFSTETFVSGGDQVQNPRSLTWTVQLTTGTRIQLGGRYNDTNNITIQNLYMNISSS